MIFTRKIILKIRFYVIVTIESSHGQYGGAKNKIIYSYQKTFLQIHNISVALLSSK